MASGRLPHVGDRASRVPVSRATGSTMSNHACFVFARLPFPPLYALSGIGLGGYPAATNCNVPSDRCGCY
jgi:hypothetical protein